MLIFNIQDPAIVSGVFKSDPDGTTSGQLGYRKYVHEGEQFVREVALETNTPSYSQDLCNG